MGNRKRLAFIVNECSVIHMRFCRIREKGVDRLDEYPSSIAVTWETSLVVDLLAIPLPRALFVET